MTDPQWHGVQPCTVVDEFGPSVVLTYNNIEPPHMRGNDGPDVFDIFNAIFGTTKPTNRKQKRNNSPREPFGNLHTAHPEMLGVLDLNTGEWLHTTQPPHAEGAD